MNKKFSLAIVLVSIAVTLSGCNSFYDTYKAGDKPGEIVCAFGYEPEEGFDPIKASTHYGTSLFQTALFKRDNNLHVVGDLAQDYNLSDDKLTYTVKLKPGIKFSDGSDLKASDVVFTYNTALNEGEASVDLSSLKNVEAPDDQTVVFTLNKPDIGFLSKMASLGIVPEHAYGPNYGSNPVGTGPFKFVDWRKGEQLIVEPNPYYYGEKIPFNKVTFLFIEDDQAPTLAQSHGADIIRVPASLIQNGKSPYEGYHLEVLKTMDNRGIAFPIPANTGEKTTDESIASGAPIGNNVTSDIAIRKAINVAIDRQALIDGALNGQGTPAYSLCDGTPWFNEDANVVQDGDLAAARKILDEAGWKEGADGIRSKDGQRAEFTLWFAYKDRENLALAFCETCRSIGIDAHAQYAQWEEIEPRMYSEPVLFGWGSYDPLELYYNYSSAYAGKSYYNSGFYKNEKVDDYFNKALSSGTEEESYKYFKLAQWDGETGLSTKGDSPWCWLVNENHLYLVRDGIDIGPQKLQSHGGGWPLLDTMPSWKVTYNNMN